MLGTGDVWPPNPLVWDTEGVGEPGSEVVVIWDSFLDCVGGNDAWWLAQFCPFVCLECVVPLARPVPLFICG